MCGRADALTIPKLLLILEVVRYLKRHAEVAGQPPNASSPAVRTRTPVGIARGYVGGAV